MIEDDKADKAKRATLTVAEKHLDIDAEITDSHVTGSAPSTSVTVECQQGSTDEKRRKTEVSTSSSSAGPMLAEPAFKRKADEAVSTPVPTDSDDFLGIIKESDATDMGEMMNIVKKRGSMSLCNDVSEVCSQPRVAAYASQLGLSPGLALDLGTVDGDDGQSWDFDVPEKRDKALAKVREERPTLFIGAPMCRAFCQLMTLSRNRCDDGKGKRLYANGVMYLKFCIQHTSYPFLKVGISYMSTPTVPPAGSFLRWRRFSAIHLLFASQVACVFME